LPERAGLADSNPARGAARDSAAATQGLPRIRQDRSRDRVRPHDAFLPDHHGGSARPLEASSVLDEAAGSSGRDVRL